MKRTFFAGILLLLVWSAGLTAHPGKVLRAVPSPCACASGLAFDGRDIWMADLRTDRLIRIDPVSGKGTASIPSPGFWPTGLAWDGKNLWSIDQKQAKIYRVDAADGCILQVIDAPTRSPEGLAWDGKNLWISDSKAKEIIEIDPEDGTAIRTLPAPDRSPQGLAFDGRFLWSADRLSDEIYMIDPASGAVILTASSPGPYPRGVAWDGQTLWIADYQTDSLYQIVCRDVDAFSTKNTREAKILFTHEVKARGQGKIRSLDVRIAIPESRPGQVIRSVVFDPQPADRARDRWDQDFALFHYENITPEKPAVTRMIVEAEISEIQYFVFPDKTGTLKDIPEQIRKTYTADGSKYCIRDPFIRQLSSQSVGQETNPYWMARRIFDTVRETLEYSLEGGWNAAPVVLQRGTGSCSEYSFAFIALCRAAGIPARYVGSIVVRGDDASLDDVFHRWPEVYLPNVGWIPMDPQGGDKPSPREQALNIGHLSNRFLITTQGGGDSEYLGWTYNSSEVFTAYPQVEVNVETFGEWEPEKQ